MKATLLAVCALLAPGMALAQPQSPEVKQLGYYIGSWQGHGQTKGGPGGAGKLSSHMTCDWFEGKFQVVCRGEETGPTGTRSFLNILAYDVAAKAYTEYAISSRGEAEYDKGGSLTGNKLTYIVTEDAGGKPVKFRYTEVRVSPALMTYRAEASPKDGQWVPIADGEIAKAR